jgi:tRNA(Ile)-lysidine synthase
MACAPDSCTGHDFRLERLVAASVDRLRLLRGVARLGLAVSGGADSVALFHLLSPLCRERGIAVTVLHLNHGLRAEAEEDARFVQALAAGAELPCLCRRADLAGRPTDGRSLEMAARDARLAFFRQCSREAALDAIATGHQADDVAETLLLRLVRGAGATGLSGLRPRSLLPAEPLPHFRKCGKQRATERTPLETTMPELLHLRKCGKQRASGLVAPEDEAASLSHLRRCESEEPPPAVAVVRPLLEIPGSALRAWLRERGLAWREDASNRDGAIPRNLVRHTLLPQLEQTWGTGLRARLCQSAEILREDDALLDELAAQRLEEMALGATTRSGAHVPFVVPTSAGLRHARNPHASPPPVEAGTTYPERAPDSISTALLLAQPPALQRRVLRLWLFRQRQPLAAGLSHVLTILERCREPGDWRLTLPGGTVAACEAETLTVRSGYVAPASAGCGQVAGRHEVCRNPAEAGTTYGECAALPVPTPQPVRWGGVEITATPDRGVFSLSSGIGHYPAVCTLSAEAIQGRPLAVRARQPGDRIAPTGLKGSKKIQDLFVDAKIPEAFRDAMPLVVCGGEVAWVPGYRVARRFAVPAPDAPSVRITVNA